MASLPSIGGDIAHKNGITDNKNEQLDPANNTDIVSDKLPQPMPDMLKAHEKTDELAKNAVCDPIPMGRATEEAADVPNSDQVIAAPAGVGGPHSEQHEKSTEDMQKGQLPEASVVQPAVAESTPAEGKDVSGKLPEDDDELAQIQKELASSEPAKAVDAEPLPIVGDSKSLDQDTPKEPSVPVATNEEGTEKEGGNDNSTEETKLTGQTTPKELESASGSEKAAEKEDGKDLGSEPMDVDENAEKKTESQNGSKETSTESVKDDSSKENCKTEEAGCKTVADEPKPAPAMEEPGVEAKTEDGLITGQTDVKRDVEEAATPSAKDEPHSEQDTMDTTNPDKETTSHPENTELKTTSDAAKKDETTDKSNSAETQEDEKESENEDGEEQVPLLERPPELSGRRARKAVDRFSEGDTPESRRGSLPLEQGRGAKLADCPVVNANIGSGAPEQVHALHQVVFGRQGRPHEFRRNLRQFSGFPFRPDEPGYSKKRDSLLRYRLDALRSLSHLLNLETKAKSREELAQGVLDFLIEPTATSTVVETAKKRASKTPRKGARASSRRSAAAASEEEEEEEEEEDDNEEEDEEESPKKAPSKRTPARRASKTPAKKTPAKKTAAKRTPAKRTPAAKTPAKSAGRKTPARRAAKRKRTEDVSTSEEEEEEAAPPVSKRAKTGRAPPRSRR